MMDDGWWMMDMDEDEDEDEDEDDDDDDDGWWWRRDARRGMETHLPDLEE